MDRRFFLIAAAVAGLLIGFFLVRLLTQDTTTETLETTTTSSSETTTTSAETPTTTTHSGGNGFPVTIEASNGAVTIPARPERIVSISPTSTEVLFAVGAGPQVVAVDDQSNYPESAPVTDLTGFTPNVEAIASFQPDVVFLSFDPGDVIAGLEAIGIPVIMHPTASSVGDAYIQWEQTGAATGNVEQAQEVVESSQESIETAVASLPENTDLLTYYYELDPTYYSATSSTFVGGLFTLTGMTNIADPADPDGFGFPQLTSEYIVDQNPSIVYLADTKCCGQNEVTVSERPGWDTMSALADDAVVELDDDIASRWGPRINDLVDDIVESILDLESADA